MKIGWKVRRELPPCRVCGKPTANFKSLVCAECTAKRDRENEREAEQAELHYVETKAGWR